MPIYEYQCLSCGERIEELQGVNDPPLTECRACGGELKRLISSPAFQFKGSGWYVTDYAKSGSSGEGSSGGASESKGEAGGSDAKEAKSSDSSSSAKSGSGDSGAKAS